MERHTLLCTDRYASPNSKRIWAGSIIIASYLPLVPWLTNSQILHCEMNLRSASTMIVYVVLSKLIVYTTNNCVARYNFLFTYNVTRYAVNIIENEINLSNNGLINKTHTIEIKNFTLHTYVIFSLIKNWKISLVKKWLAKYCNFWLNIFTMITTANMDGFTK